VERVAVLASGGLDSSVLLAELAETVEVFPLYVHQGLAWEDAEHRALVAFVAALEDTSVSPVTALSVPAQELYGDHWSLTGRGVPGADTPDDAVFLPGRNVLLLGLAAIWCSTHGIHRVAIGSLGDNPFPDATPDFFSDYAGLLSRALGHQVTVEAPYRGLTKAELVRRRRDLPLELTLTCIAPRDASHCGACNKCHERQKAFQQAGVTDPTTYATAIQRGARG
jgi:7-cyano-7-deazaguanine synthase